VLFDSSRLPGARQLHRDLIYIVVSIFGVSRPRVGAKQRVGVGVGRLTNLRCVWAARQVLDTSVISRTDPDIRKQRISRRPLLLPRSCCASCRNRRSSDAMRRTAAARARRADQTAGDLALEIVERELRYGREVDAKLVLLARERAGSS